MIAAPHDVLAARTFVGADGERKIQQISRIWEMCLHGGRQVELGEVYSATTRRVADPSASSSHETWGMHTFLHTDLRRARLWLPPRRRILVLLHTPDLVVPRQYAICAARPGATLTLIMAADVYGYSERAISERGWSCVRPRQECRV